MLKSDIKKIISEVKALNSSTEKLSFLHNKFQGQTCYVLGCGPSLKSVDKEKLISEVQDNCLFTIKQSFFPFQEYVDFHFFNTNNFINYPEKKDVFYWGSTDGNSIDLVRQNFWGQQRVDGSSSISFETPLTRKQYADDFDLENYTINNNFPNRNWGAGIMFEIVLFFSHHLGFEKVRTVGWDYIDVNNGQKELVHFYKESDRQKLRNPAAPPYETEMRESIELAGLFADFFKKHGKTLECHESEECFLPNNVTRYKL